MNDIANTSLDPTLQFSTLTIDDQLYKLVYSFASIAVAESVAKCNLLQGLGNLTSLNAQELLGLTYAALLVLQPRMTMEQAAHLVRLDTIQPVTMALAEAYSLSLPQSKKKVEDEAPNQS